MGNEIEERNRTIDDCFKGENEPTTSSFYYEALYPIVYDLVFFHWLEYLTLKSEIDLHNGESVLEIGAGYPLHLFYSSEIGETGRYIGLDTNSGTVRRANSLIKRLELDSYVYHSKGDAFDIQCPDEIFDKVIAVNFWTGESTKPPSNELYHEIHRVLKPNGQYYERFFSYPFDSDGEIVCKKLMECGFYEVSQRKVIGGFPFLHKQITARKEKN